MAVRPSVTTESSVIRTGGSIPARLRARVKRAVERRSGRVRVILLVTVLLLPLLLTTLLGGR